jgi:hypothetical protein
MVRRARNVARIEGVINASQAAWGKKTTRKTEKQVEDNIKMELNVVGRFQVEYSSSLFCTQ